MAIRDNFKITNICSWRRGALATGLLSKVAVTLIGCILVSNGCRLLSVKQCMLLSKVAGYCQWVSYSALVMLLGTSLSEGEVFPKVGNNGDCSYVLSGTL